LRGWKHFRNFHNFYHFRKSPTRLEGMETNGTVYNAIGHRRLRPALRGWKPFTFSHREDLRGTSPTRLEGMETHSALQGKEKSTASPTRLEGMETFFAGAIVTLKLLVSDPP